MRSIAADPAARRAWSDEPVVRGILDAIAVEDEAGYRSVVDSFAEGTASTQREERVEHEERLLRDRNFIHDRRSMVVFRVRDDSQAPLHDFDLLFTAGDDDPNALPEGFATDRQRNQHDPGTLTYFFNHDLMHGCDAVEHDGEVIRPAREGASRLGLRVDPRPTDGFVHYLPAGFDATAEVLSAAIRPNETTLIDIVLRRNVREGVFRLDRDVGKARAFDKDKPGPIV